ncbi:MAG TPA: succinate dehydrogenase cytochrome b subunit [Opitutaceae bacterium]|nr:succinate dehydrogenase cytochrome b subunit [Opitutaceae bacterium]
MNLLGSFFRSSIGRKVIMAVTGLVLFGFVIGHLTGNLQIFQHPDRINGYAQFLHNLGPMLWVARIGLLVAVVLHIWAATALTIENRQARGPENYAVRTWLRATISSRYVRWTGYIVAAFIVYHLAHFTFGATDPADFKGQHRYVMQDDYAMFGLPAIKAGTEVGNVYLMVYRGFESVPVSIFYIVAVGLLSLHLLHGVDSVFQTFGLRSEQWGGALRRLVAVICVLYFVGNLAIPAAIVTGLLKPHPAAQVHGPASAAR